MVKRIVCKQCGAVNILDENSDHEDFVPCDIPKDLDWFLPMKKTVSYTGEPIFIDQQGINLSREQYILAHNIDPEIADTKMKYHVCADVSD